MDVEYTNGNYYLGDIFDIAVLSENSGYAFHSYINIRYKIPKYLKTICNTTDTMIKNSQPFCKVMKELIQFINHEEEGGDTPATATTIIAHGGYQCDFPLLIANCMKKEYDFRTPLAKYKFIDSMKVFQSMGYIRPGLDALSNIITGGGTAKKCRVHSAIQDVELLRDIVKKLLLKDITTISSQHTYTLGDILQYMNEQLPVSITKLYKLAADASSNQSLESKLRKHAVIKTALNEKQLCKIAYYYY